jgi:hypothetical protein
MKAELVYQNNEYTIVVNEDGTAQLILSDSVNNL